MPDIAELQNQFNGLSYVLVPPMDVEDFTDANWWSWNVIAHPQASELKKISHLAKEFMREHIKTIPGDINSPDLTEDMEQEIEDWRNDCNKNFRNFLVSRGFIVLPLMDIRWAGPVEQLEREIAQDKLWRGF